MQFLVNNGIFKLTMQPEYHTTEVRQGKTYLCPDVILNSPASCSAEKRVDPVPRYRVICEEIDSNQELGKMKQGHVDDHI